MATLLGRQDSIISIEWYANVRHAPLPLCKFGTNFELTNRHNLTEELFFGLLAKNRTKSE